MYSLQDINLMERVEFMEKVGWVFEHSPWIANKAWIYKPFENIEILHQIMVQVVMDASKEDQLDLIRAHPDLGSRIKMTESSVQEQKGAGLDQLTEDEFNNFASLNKKYLNKYNFPFILAVKGHTKHTIFATMEKRMSHSVEEEFQTALKEIYKIAKFRLLDFITNEQIT
jgi:OHCU decarboxylase